MNPNAPMTSKPRPARQSSEWSDVWARDISALDLGLATGMALIDQLQELKTIARAATEPALGPGERAEQQAAYDEVVAEIQAGLRAARFEGLNLLVNERLDGPGDTLTALGPAPVLAGDWSLGRPSGAGIAVSPDDRLDDPDASTQVLERILMSFIWASSEVVRLQRVLDEALDAYGPTLVKALRQPPVTDRIRRPADARTARYIAQAAQALVGPDQAIANRRPRHLLRLGRPPLTSDTGHLPGRVERRT